MNASLPWGQRVSGRDLVDDLRRGAKPAPKAVRSIGPVDFLLVVVAVMALGGAGYFGAAAWLAGHPSGNAPPPGMAAPSLLNAVANSRSPRAVWTDDDTARCRSKARTAAEAPVPDDLVMANPSVTPGFAGLATMLECQMTTKVSRFCDGAEKAKLVSAINDYLARSDIVVAAMGVQGAPMAAMGHLFGGEVAAGSGMYEIEHEATLAFIQVYHAKVVGALKSLARNGIVGPPDFAGFLGWGVPDNVRAMFGDVQAERSICA